MSECSGPDCTHSSHGVKKPKKVVKKMPSVPAKEMPKDKNGIPYKAGSRKERRKSASIKRREAVLNLKQKVLTKKVNAVSRQRNLEKNMREKKLALKEQREAYRKEIALKEGVAVSRVVLIGTMTDKPLIRGTYIIKQARPLKAPKQDTPKWRKKKGLI